VRVQRKKKERNVAQTESALKQDRLCVACLSAEINPDLREASHIERREAAGLRHFKMNAR
jgi:hypothetical protein